MILYIFKVKKKETRRHPFFSLIKCDDRILQSFCLLLKNNSSNACARVGRAGVGTNKCDQMLIDQLGPCIERMLVHSILQRFDYNTHTYVRLNNAIKFNCATLRLWMTLTINFFFFICTFELGVTSYSVIDKIRHVKNMPYSRLHESSMESPYI